MTETAFRLLGDGTVALGFALLDASGNVVSFSPSNYPVGSRLVAYNDTASFAVPTTPTPLIWTATSTNDSQWDVSNGVITFAQNCLFNSVFFANLSNTGGANTVLTYHTDAEVSVDGVTWVRGANSMRQETVRGSDNNASRNFPFSGGFLKGQRLRFVHWASNGNCRVTTDTDLGSTCPAHRLTYNYLPITFIV